MNDIALAYDIKEAARMLRLSPRTIAGMIDRGEIPVSRFGAKSRSVRISHATLEAILLARQEVVKPKG